MKVKMLNRSAVDYVRETKDDIHKLPRNYSPALHPFEAAREYSRAVNAVKLERVFAKPLVGALDGHADAVSDVATHPLRLALCASSAADGVVKVWDVASRSCLSTLTGHGGKYCRGLTFLPNGQRLVTVGDDKQIQFYKVDDVEDLDEEQRKKPRKPIDSISTKGVVSGVSYHRHDNSFATCGDATILWDAEMQSPIQEYQWGVDSVHCVSFNQVESNLLGACASDRSIVLYDIRESRPMRKVVMELRSNAMAWNPMEAFVFAVANEDYNSYAFDIRRLKRPLNVHMGHTSAVIDVDYSPTGKEIVTGSYDKTVRIFPVDQGHSREVYHTKRMQRLTCVAWTRDNKYLLSGSDEFCIRIWKAKAWEKLGHVKDRERSALHYAEKLKEKYANHPQVKRIARHRHVPKHVRNAEREHRIIKDSKKKKEANRRKHTAPGKVPYVSERDRHIIEEQE